MISGIQDGYTGGFRGGNCTQTYVRDIIGNGFQGRDDGGCSCGGR